MTDLPHIFNSDITVQETQVLAAPTEFSAQKAGEDCNFLFDQWPALIASIATLNASRSRVDVVALTLPGIPGNQTAYTTPNGLPIQAAFFSSPQVVNNYAGVPSPIVSAFQSGGTGRVWNCFGFNFFIFPQGGFPQNLIVDMLSGSGTLQLFGAIVYQGP